jgi:predicted nuclease with TOPRIM domain
MIEELLDLSRQSTKELKIAKRQSTEKMKEQENQLSTLEKRLLKLDDEKESLNQRLIELQTSRSMVKSAFLQVSYVMCI